jgi:hypothetical protein
MKPKYKCTECDPECPIKCVHPAPCRVVTPIGQATPSAPTRGAVGKPHELVPGAVVSQVKKAGSGDES